MYIIADKLHIVLVVKPINESLWHSGIALHHLLDFQRNWLFYVDMKLLPSFITLLLEPSPKQDFVSILNSLVVFHVICIS